ncbi:MAG: ABC transporter permease subunit, partial [Deinococcales bacterium]
PLALPQIVSGINQTIMMAFGIVVIAALIGANGLGRSVLQALQRLEVGRGTEAGLAIAFMAIALDRVSYGFSQAKAPSLKKKSWLRRYGLDLVLLTLCLVVLWLPPYATVANVELNALKDYPKTWQFSIRQPIDGFVTWARDNLYQIGNLPLGTGPLSDAIIIYGIKPLNWFFETWLPWPLLILGMTVIAWYLAGKGVAIFSLISLLSIGFLSMWEPTLESLSQILVGTVLTVILALALGILSSRSTKLRGILEPLLDILQTIPSFVYLIPVIMLFNIGFIPGIIASILYALPPGIRMIDLGIRQVSRESVEAARAFGSSPPQLLTKVELPLALPSIMLGINQIIMMILAMVVIAGLVGSGGLGLEAVTGLARNQTGQGIEAGLAIVLLAMVFDRVIQTWALKQQKAQINPNSK